MKRICAFVIAFLLLLSSAVGEEIDLTGMTVGELADLRQRINDEIASRGIRGRKTMTLTEPTPFIVAQDEDLLLYMTGRTAVQGAFSIFQFEMVFENYSDASINIQLTDCKLNNWIVNGHLVSERLNSGEKRRCILQVNYDEAFLRNETEMETFQFRLISIDESYKTRKDYGIYSITFDHAYWGN